MLSNTLQANSYYKIREKGNDYHVNFYLRVRGRFETFSASFGAHSTLLNSQLTCFAYALTDEQKRYNTLLQLLIEDVNYYEKVVFAGSGGSSSGGGGSDDGGDEG